MIAVMGIVQCGHFADRGSLQMRTFALFDPKNVRFFEIYTVPVQIRGRGLSQCGYFADKGVQFFTIFAGLFWTVP